MTHKLVLDLPINKKLNEILSEGEQRAIAIGSFLAELHLADHSGPIVFDDPVSSLDHHRRQSVCCRLAKEALKRQVIVLTHDTVFLSELCEEIKRLNAPHIIHSMEWKGSSSGYILPGLPWEHKSYEDRIDRLEKAQKTISKNWSPYPCEETRLEMRKQYSFLRATIERVVQDVVFNGVVKRYEQYIRIERLKDVIGFEQREHDEILRLYRFCHDVTEAHDPSSAKNAPVPNPQQLLEDIVALHAVVNRIRSRKKADNIVSIPVTAPLIYETNYRLLY